MKPRSRVLCWFSCGAASAVAAEQAIARFAPDHPIELVYNDMSRDEHSDNVRFAGDVSRWLGYPVVALASEYLSVDDVFRRHRYMAGPKGARCTVEMKRIPRKKYQRPDDIHVFGLTSDEARRAKEFVARNPDLDIVLPLLDSGTTKKACLARLTEVGIELPTMYRLGFKNNNCIGCVKATSPAYWNRVRLHFPEVFAKRVAQSRELRVRLVELPGKKRAFLDELPEGLGLTSPITENLSCGPQCGVQP